MSTKEKEGISKAIIKQYKDLIDFVYSLTHEKDYTEGFAAYRNNRLSAIVTELVKRGVLEKKSNYNGHGVRYSFTWVASSAPTPHFVNSVAAVVEGKTREYQRRSREKKRNEEKREIPGIESTKNVSTPAEPEKPRENENQKENPLAAYSPAELWAELKRRGAVILDGKVQILTPLE
ncbi:MAG: hypothetical protein IK114_14115 [Fibrobacter sp.]|nr:hypothetical protein [Fibrobacter sp.]